MSNNLTVVVLAGGLSHEREVSLRSGRRVSQALKDQGLDVVSSDLSAGLLPQLKAIENPVVFPVLHGGPGEDGSVLQVLQLAGVPFVGSKAAAARLAFDKSIGSCVMRQAGLNVPRQVALPFDMFVELGAEGILELLATQLSFPMMVKPSRGGSALGCTKVNHPNELSIAMRAAFAYGPVAVFEDFVAGTEVSVAVIQRDGHLEALPAVEIRPKSGVYDYTARYTAGETRFISPAGLDDDVARICAQHALTAHELLGLRHVSRTDLIVDQDGIPWFLEVSVAPGMTETSLVPLAIESVGYDFGEICSQWVKDAKDSSPSLDSLSV